MTKIIAAAAALAVTLSACETPPPTMPMAERFYHVNRYLTAYREEPRGSCQSENLVRATDRVKTALNWTAYDNEIHRVATLTLDVADAAADGDCPDEARALYRYVISTFIGGNYAAYRQRAEIGMAELRDPRQQ